MAIPTLILRAIICPEDHYFKVEFMDTVISMNEICKNYIMGDVVVKALRDVDIKVKKGNL